MKRILTFVLVVAVICCCTSLSAFADSEPIIAVSDVIGKPGANVNVVVSLKNNPGIVTMRLDVSYDSEVMTLTKVSDHALLPGKMHGNDLSSVPYCLFWDNGASTEDYAVDGDLVTLTFALKESAADGKYPVVLSYDYDNFDIFNMNLEPVEFNIENGSVKVNSVTKPQMIADNVVMSSDATALTLRLLSPENISGVVVVATYNENKEKLCNVKIYAASDELNVNIENKGGKEMQIMWLKSFATLSPVTEVITVKLDK